MNAVISWVVPPRKRNVGIVNAGVDSFCRANGFSHRDSLRLQVCVEGVFGYCVGNIRSQGKRSEITLSLYWIGKKIQMIMQHNGPGGEWDDLLKDDSDPKIRRTSFESMGLFIAKEILQSLSFEDHYDIATGDIMKSYELVFMMECRDED